MDALYEIAMQRDSGGKKRGEPPSSTKLLDGGKELLPARKTVPFPNTVAGILSVFRKSVSVFSESFTHKGTNMQNN